MDDTQIIDLYWDRDQGAITATAGKYGSFLHALSWNILRSHHDAEECVNDTYFRAWNAMPPQRPGILSAFFGKLTRNLSLDRWRYNRAAKRGGPQVETALEELGECLPAPGRPEDHLEEPISSPGSSGSSPSWTGCCFCGGTGTWTPSRPWRSGFP